ncbi:MAG: TerB family tellurite resistance protein [Ideonella sp.]|nr:TerB family tellurite resistance protein [Ideonella sp.]
MARWSHPGPSGASGGSPIRTLKDLFDSVIAPVAAGPAAPPDAHALQLATAVLLVEVMRADTHFAATERDAVLATLARTFDLAADEQARLVELATTQAKVAHDLHSFTSVLNERLDDAGGSPTCCTCRTGPTSTPS